MTTTHPRRSLNGLHYSLENDRGISRAKSGKMFRFFNSKGKILKTKAVLERIKSLRIPPAWTDVWISEDPASHLQATGKDAKGRKQYIYHPQWREHRQQTKFHHLLDFARVLPKIRRVTARDLRRKGLPKEKVVATVVNLLEVSLIRVGNEEYSRSNHSYGLTTMRDRHAKIRGGRILFHFMGKSKKEHSITLSNKRLASIVKQCRDLPGQILFQYVDDRGKIHHLSSTDVNAYIKEIAGGEFTAKDFRTWAGTVLAAMALTGFKKFDSHAEAKRNVTRAIESVARKLGNTPTICRKCYVHPHILESYINGKFLKTLKQRTEQTLMTSLKHFRSEEGAVLAFLQRELSSRV